MKGEANVKLASLEQSVQVHRRIASGQAEASAMMLVQFKHNFTFSRAYRDAEKRHRRKW